MSGGGSSESWRGKKGKFGGNTRNPLWSRRREEAGPFEVLTGGGDSLRFHHSKVAEARTHSPQT